MKYGQWSTTLKEKLFARFAWLTPPGGNVRRAIQSLRCRSLLPAIRSSTQQTSVRDGSCGARCHERGRCTAHIGRPMKGSNGKRMRGQENLTIPRGPPRGWLLVSWRDGSLRPNNGKNIIVSHLIMVLALSMTLSQSTRAGVSDCCCV